MVRNICYEVNFVLNICNFACINSFNFRLLCNIARNGVAQLSVMSVTLWPTFGQTRNLIGYARSIIFPIGCPGGRKVAQSHKLKEALF